MIGQNIIKSQIQNQIDNKTYPRFSILEGPKGSGKKLLGEWISNKLGCHFVLVTDIGVNNIRECISQAYKVTEPTMYLFVDVQNMSVIAQNSILKVTEEPPNNAYFMITCEDKSQVLDTIRSRGSAYHMDAYSIDELMQYARDKHISIPNVNSLDVYELCETPYELDYLNNYGFSKYFNFIDLVFSSIATVSGSNSLKIASSINLTSAEDTDKIELNMFWKGFINVCMKHTMDDPVKCASGSRLTCLHLQELRTSGINKQMCFDSWLFDIRQEWM